jgi:hypothetical protein
MVNHPFLLDLIKLLNPYHWCNLSLAFRYFETPKEIKNKAEIAKTITEIDLFPVRVNKTVEA